MKVKLLLCLISGVLTGLSFNSASLSCIIWAALVPFIYAINKSDFKAGIWGGFIFGISFAGSAIFWLGNVTILGLVLLLLYLSIYPILFFLLGRLLFRRPAGVFSLPALWVILELARENVWCGFGWINLGYTQYRNLYFIQPADLLGVKLISFIIVMVNVLIWEVLAKKKYLWAKILIAGVIIFASVGYSIYKIDRIKPASYVDISVVQPNIEQQLKWDVSAAESIVDKLLDLGRKTQGNSLVVFPEASWPYIVNYSDRETVDKIAELSKELKRFIIMGAVKRSEERFYNTAVMFDEGGVLKGDYDKIKLVPFGEYVPLRKFLKFINVINAIGDMAPGTYYREFSWQDKIFSVLICFEDVLPGHVWRFSKGKDFLVNITNDGWFGGNPQASQHLGIMVFRAIENRIPIIRCANTGISGWVSSLGRIEKLTADGKDVLFDSTGNFRVALGRGAGLYQIGGEFFPIICGLIVLSIVIFKNER